ncbi:MAG TPA: PAS domain S-box protein [Candidatus Dormibacteraeota bacterium]|nr:PAS domain S-box protein [Candidatus Dormibacteraeota bacterium]
MSQSAPSWNHEFKPELQVILDAVVEGVCGVDAQGKATFCNDALLKITGYEADEIIGKNLHELLHHSRPDGTPYPAKDCPFHKAIMAHEEARIVGEHLWRKDGICFPTEHYLRPLQPSQGPTCFVATFKDLTEIHQTKAVLRKSEEKFRRILTNMPEVAWTSDRHGRILYISPKVEAMLGYSKPEIFASGRHLWLGQIHAKDFGRVTRAYKALFEKKAPLDEEYRIRRKDGTWIWVHDRAVNSHEENGELRADGFLSDITRRKQAEAELHSQTAFLQAQTNSTIDGMLVVDRYGQKLMANERLAQIFNISPELMADKDDGKMLAYVITLIREPETFLAKVKYLYQHPDETSRDEMELRNGMFLDRYSSPVVDKHGVYYGRIWTFRDITERKRNEDKLQQLSLAVEQSPVSVVITNPQGEISYVNRKFTECTGYTAEEVIGSNPRVLQAGHCPKELYHDLWSTITQGRVWHGEFCNKRKNGDIFWEAATITPITNPKGAITHFLAVKEDITERRALEGQLRHAQKLEGIGQLAAGIAHEINTPTQFVSDNLTFLRDSWKSIHELLEQYRGAIAKAAAVLPPEVQAALQEAEQHCDLEFIVSEVPRAIDQSLDGAGRVARIVRAMKEFSHPDSSDKTATDLNKAIDSTITVARNEWKYVADLAKEFDESLPAVVCYPGDINQVVLNLIVNAAHAIKEKVQDGDKGRITVGTRQRGEFVEILVTDTGNGIPEAIRGRVFDPFFTTKEVGKGTGQGLALAYTVVVKKHGGKIWFETEVGKGTTFFVALPLQRADSGKEA